MTLCVYIRSCHAFAFFHFWMISRSVSQSCLCVILSACVPVCVHCKFSLKFTDTNNYLLLQWWTAFCLYIWRRSLRKFFKQNWLYAILKENTYILFIKYEVSLCEVNGWGGGVSCACIFRVLYMALAWLLIHCCYVILQHDCRVWTLDLLCRHTASPSVGKDLLSLCSSIQSIAFYKEREH